MEIKELAKKYNRAKIYKNGVKSPFFKELKAKLEKEIDITIKGAIFPGFTDKDEEHDRIIEARAYKKLLNFIEEQPQRAERLKEQLEKLGQKAD
jgi:hypothetical protein